MDIKNNINELLKLNYRNLQNWLNIKTIKLFIEASQIYCS